MTILDTIEYHKVIQPLRQVTINNLFARAVAEHTVTGKIFVDDVVDPTTFYIVHPYGMSLLFGNAHNERFNTSFKTYALNTNNTRNSVEWLQAFPDEWDSVFASLFHDRLVKSSDNMNNVEKGIIELNTRVNFKFDLKKYSVLQKRTGDPDISIVRATGEMFRAMQGSVVPQHFWDSEEDFMKNGMAFALFYKGELASMSFSSYWFDNEFELGIETKEQFRGKGFAELACRAIIDHCIEKNYVPIWSCRLENTGSYLLAQKLGFVPTRTFPYYRLSK